MLIAYLLQVPAEHAVAVGLGILTPMVLWVPAPEVTLTVGLTVSPAVVETPVPLVEVLVKFRARASAVPAAAGVSDVSVTETTSPVVPVEVTESSALVLPEMANDPKVPTEVRDELTTVALRVVPVRVPAGAMTALPEAAVMSPLPLTVKVGMDVEDPKVPTFPLTVARVVARDPADVVMSPVRAGNLPAASVPVALVPERSTGWAVMTWPAMVR